MIGCAAVAVLAAGAAAQDAPSRAQVRQAQNNLRQIGLAFHNFHDVSGALPTDVKGKDGKALLSWRVAILPYIEEGELYKQFKMNEPWDSAHNKPLAAKMPKLYAPVRGKAKEGETFYQVFTGEKTVFDGKRKTLVSMTDGTSNTGMVFEAGEAVPWTKPADLAFDEKKDLPKLGGMFDGMFHVCLADGSVKPIRKDADATQLKYLVMPADGNVVDFKKLEQK
jgi:hypothetical protein